MQRPDTTVARATAVARCALARIVIGTARMGTSCVYEHADRGALPVWGVTCTAEGSVPAGCPIGFVAPPGFETPATLDVLRGDVATTLDVTADRIETVEVSVSTIDHNSCDCAAITVIRPVQRIQMSLDTVAGDVVTLPGPAYADADTVVIEDAAPCPEPAWPTAFSESFACDLCPGETPGPSEGDDDGGCAVGGSAGLAMSLVIAGVLLRRRAD